jgi:protoheme ferro-lyase
MVADVNSPDKLQDIQPYYVQLVLDQHIFLQSRNWNYPELQG